MMKTKKTNKTKTKSKLLLAKDLDTETYDKIRYCIKLEDSFYEFVKEAWSIVDSHPFKNYWHMRVICDHLQAVYEGKITRLIINIPPGFAKSLLSSVLFPAWVWTKDPTHRFLTGSNRDALSLRDTVKSRDLITSTWYKYCWGSVFKLRADQNQKSNYINDKKGHRIAFSVSGRITGERCDTAIVDDPVDVSDQYSKKAMDRANHIINNSLMKRLADPVLGKIIIIMQRLSEDDPTGYALKKSNRWVNLRLPLICEDNSRCVTPIFTDNRKDGEILEGKITLETSKELKKESGERDFACQYQQRPYSLAGNIIKREWFRYYRELPTRFDFIVMAGDTACKIKKKNDGSAFAIIGYYECKFYLIGLWIGKVEFPELKKVCWQLFIKYRPNKIIIEDASSGQQLVQELRRPPIVSDKELKEIKEDEKIVGKLPIDGVGVMNKEERAMFVSVYFELGEVLFPEDAPWLIDCIDSLVGFPGLTHDDDVDAICIGLMYLKEKMKIPRIRRL